MASQQKQELLPRLNLLVVSSGRVNSIDIDSQKKPLMEWVNDMKKRMRLVGEESIIVERTKKKEGRKINATLEILPRVVSRYDNKQNLSTKETMDNNSLRSR